jgi:sulfate/thiosulfate transport system ATP-binding protein
MIAGFERPDAGRIVIGDIDVTETPPHRRPVNTVFQSYALFPHMTLAQNVAFGLENLGWDKARRNARVAEMLGMVHMTAFAARKPAQLSGGQRQRIALARALAPEPQVLLLDEPFGALDARVRAELREWLRRLHDEVHVTTIFVTHDQAEAMDVASQIAVMNHARIEQVGTPTELYDAPTTEFVMRFVGEASAFGDGWVRPHELDVATDPEAGALEVMIQRITTYGFDARIELVPDEGEPLIVQLTRERLELLELEEGQIVWVRATGERTFA